MAAIGVICETTFSTCVRGYHVYQGEWTPMLDKTLSCCHELANMHDPFAVKVMKADAIVGHIYRRKLVLLAHCSL